MSGSFDEECARIASNDPSLQHAYNHFVMDSEKIFRLASALRTNTHINTFFIFDRNMNIESAGELARVLRANRTIRMLQIGCHESVECARELMSVLDENTTITRLDLYIWLPTSCAQEIARIVMTSKTLHELVLSSTMQVDDVTRAMRVNTSIVRLDLSNCMLSTRELFNILSTQNKTLKTLQLNRIITCDDGLHEVAHMLLVNATLTSLEMPCANLEQIDAFNIAHALRINRTLTYLDMMECKIHDDGIIAIANALEMNHTLEHLYVGGRDITSVGIAAVARLLRANTSLESLSIGMKKAGDDEVQMFTSAMETNDNLRKIAIYCVRTQHDEFAQFWDLLEKQTQTARVVRAKDKMITVALATREPHSPLSLLPGDGAILRNICAMCKALPFAIYP